MQTLAQFDGYRLRSIEETDYITLSEWIALDAHHAGLLTPEFFMGQTIGASGGLEADPRVTAFALEQSRGPLMFIRLTRASRVHIQFAPGPESKRSQEIHRHRQQIANALFKGMAFLEVGLSRAGAAEWIFDTESHALRSLAQRRMGFTASPHELVRPIPREGPEQGLEQSMLREQQISEEGV